MIRFGPHFPLFLKLPQILFYILLHILDRDGFILIALLLPLPKQPTLLLIDPRQTPNRPPITHLLRTQHLLRKLPRIPLILPKLIGLLPQIRILQIPLMPLLLLPLFILLTTIPQSRNIVDFLSSPLCVFLVLCFLFLEGV